MNKHVVIGYSGHAYVVIEAALKAGLNVRAYAEKARAKFNPFELDYLGFEEDSDFNGWNNEYSFILGVGDNTVRSKIAELILTRNEALTTVVHPEAAISKKSDVDSGSFISSGAQINALTQVGKAVIVNTSAVVEHECMIGDYSHIAPGAVLAGNVKVGKRSFVGANSVAKEGVSIGDDVVVGAGTVVLHDVPNGSKMVGNPGRVL